MTIRILIADDEPNQLELLSYNLSSADFEVLRASDGQQALEMVEEHRPDLAIIDWMMPHMSGIDLCRKLRSRNETKNMPIIILSARGEEGDRTLGLDIGADDYISKPFSPRELISLWCIGRHCAGDVVLDTGPRRVPGSSELPAQLDAIRTQAERMIVAACV